MLPIDSVADYLEQKYSLSLYYQPEWFKNKDFSASLLNAPKEKILAILKNGCNCSYMLVDSLSVVFVPNDGINNSSAENNVTTIGNPREYEKYTHATINGKILDSKTDEPLAGAYLIIEKTKTTVVTDKSGNFKLSLPVGEYDIILHYIGYEDNYTKIKLIGDGTATFEIIEKSVVLNEVFISAGRTNNIANTKIGVVQINKKEIKELPLLMGETDVIKSATLMPGVQTVGEFGSGFNVRGSGTDQNLILIENVPVFNSYHMFGLTSVLNSDGISDVTLLKASIPAKYGERASSIMDIGMGTMNAEKINITGGIGLIDSHLTVDLPLLKNKINLLVGGSTTYSDWLLHSIPDLELMNSSVSFYDLNGLLTITPDSKNKIVLFGYFSNDNFGLSNNGNSFDITKYQYTNTLASIRWYHNFDHHLSSNLISGISRYKFQMNELDTTQRNEAYQLASGVLYNNAKWDLSWHPENNYSFNFGANAVLYTVEPGSLAPYESQSQITPVHENHANASEYAIYLSTDMNFNKDFNAEIGLRYTLYGLKGPGNVYIYKDGNTNLTANIIDSVNYNKNQLIKSSHGLEPRISLRYSINKSSSVKISYNRIHQYIQLVSNSAVMSPVDFWKLCDKYLKPLECNQYSAGYFHNFQNNKIEVSVELYHETMSNLIEYKNGAQMQLNDHIETELLNAKGHNYGLEIYVKKNAGKLAGWVSYTYSRSMVKTNCNAASDQINNNNWFASNYDKPNDFVVNVNYHLSRRWKFSSLFAYSTGRSVSLPEMQYNYNGFQLISYSDRNKYRLPDYHRLDVSITFDESLTLKKNWKGSWILSIINVYGRQNAYSVYYQKNNSAKANNQSVYSLYELYIIGGPFPTLTYNFTF